jgi:hypothetical protein
LADSPFCIVLASIDCLLFVASSCDIAGLTRGGGHSEGLLIALGDTSIVVRATSCSYSTLIVAVNISL